MKKMLQDVMIMRPIVVILLVFMHSFTMFTHGSWTLPDGIHDVPAYNWLTKITFSFLLETFIFISGYLLSAQFERHVSPFLEFAQKKAKRLLLPSVVFSILYLLLFKQYQGTGGFLLSILEGSGHMWYLPMSFWCFLGGYMLYKMKLPTYVKLMACATLSCCSGGLGFLPFRLNSAAYYMIFFYLGMVIYENRSKFINVRPISIAALCVGYIISFVVLRPFIEEINSRGGGIVFKMMRIFFIPLSKIVYSSLGLFAFYSMVNFFLNNHPCYQSPSWLIYLNSISFGIYIYHQFILKLLYYHTSLPSLAGTYALPWLGFVLALMISMLLSSMTIRNKIGKYLIG